MRKWYLVGAKFGHCGCGRCAEVYIPIYASGIMHAYKRAQQMGGLKKAFNDIWHIEEIRDPFKVLEVRANWLRVKWWMKRKEKRRRSA